MRSPPLDGRADVGLGAVRRADGVEHVEGAARGPAVQRSRQGADGRHDGGTEVGPGRRHDAGGEGRRVEAVVDGQDHVLLDGPGVQGGRLGAGQHVEVVGGEAEVVPRLHGLFPLPQPVGRRQNRRHDRAQPERLVVQLVGADVVRRAPTELGRQERDRGAQHVERRAATADGRQHRAQPRRAGRAGAGPPRRRPPRPPRRGARPGTGGARRPRASAFRPARPPSTAGSGRSPPCRVRRRWWSRRPPRLRAPPARPRSPRRQGGCGPPP